MSISQHSHKFYQYEFLRDSPCTNNLWGSASSQLTFARKTSPLTLAAESKYMGRTPWEGGTSQLVCDSPYVWKRKWWLYASLHFSFLGQEEQANLMQVWKALELLVPVPHWQLGPAGVSGCFQPCLCTTVEQPGLRWHCVTPSSTAAGQLGHDSAAPQHEWGWSVDSGKLVVSALLPTLYLICVLLCNQPKRMFPFNQPVILTALPQQSPVLLLEIDTCHETLIIQKIASRHSSEKWILWDIFGQLRRSKLCKKVPTVTFPPEPRSRIWTDLHK